MEKSLTGKVHFFENLLHAKISQMQEKINLSNKWSDHKEILWKSAVLDEVLFDFEEIFKDHLYEERLYGNDIR